MRSNESWGLTTGCFASRTSKAHWPHGRRRRLPRDAARKSWRVLLAEPGSLYGGSPKTGRRFFLGLTGQQQSPWAQPPMLFWGRPWRSNRRDGAKGWLELVLRGKKPTIVTLTLALSACAAPQLPQIALWSKPGASYDAFLQDRSACIQAARTTSGGFVSGGVGDLLPPDAALSGDVVNAQIFWPCMAAHGWGYNPAGGYGPPPSTEVWAVTPPPDEWANWRSNYVANRHHYLPP